MKKFIPFAAALILCLSCAACGCSNSAPATTPNTGATIPSTMPSTILPTMETNIPDTEVNDNSTIGTDATDATGGNNGSDSAMGGKMGSRMK